jgi:hypothetical protein
MAIGKLLVLKKQILNIKIEISVAVCIDAKKPTQKIFQLNGR